MIYQDFFYWFGVGSLVLLSPFMLWATTLLPVIFSALLERGLNAVHTRLEDYWWPNVAENNFEDYKASKEAGTWPYRFCHMFYLIRKANMDACDWYEDFMSNLFEKLPWT